MQVHYVEDDATDARMMTSLARRHLDLDISVSQSLEDLPKYVLEKPVDCILLDVNRPESVSVEEDIRQIRRYTTVPIIFVTGEEREGLRLEAFRAGAESMINKNSLSPEVLREVIDNVQARFQAEQEVVEVPPPSLEVSHHNPRLDELGAPLEYLQTSLVTLTEAMVDNGFEVSAGLLQHLTETTEAIRSFAKSDLSDGSRVRINAVFENIRQRINSIADHKKIRLSIEAEDAWYSQAGPAPLALLGIQHLLEGLMRAALPSTYALIYAARHEDGAKLMVYFSKKFLPDTDIFFEADPESSVVGLDAACSLRLGALLLYLRKEQIKITSTGDDQMVTITL